MSNMYEYLNNWFLGIVGAAILGMLGVVFNYAKKLITSYNVIERNYELQNRELTQLKLDFEDFKNEMKQELLITKDELTDTIEKNDENTREKLNALSAQYGHLLTMLSNLSAKVDTNHSTLVQMMTDNNQLLIATLVDKLTTRG